MWRDGISTGGFAHKADLNIHTKPTWFASEIKIKIIMK